MLRRPPTVLTLTSEDVKAYEDRHEALAFKHLTSVSAAYKQQQAHPQHHHRILGTHQQPPQHLANSMSGMDLTSSSSDDGQRGEEQDYYDDDDEVSYYPSRFRSAAATALVGEGDSTSDIYRHEGARSEASPSTSPDLIHGAPPRAVRRRFVDSGLGDEDVDMDMEMLGAGVEEEGFDDDDVRAENYSPNMLNQQSHSPPPAPARVTRAMSREPPTSSASTQRHASGSSATATNRFGRGGRGAATEAVTPTNMPSAAGRSLFRGVGGAGVTTPPEAPARATRSREERIGGAAAGGAPARGPRR